MAEAAVLASPQLCPAAVARIRTALSPVLVAAKAIRRAPGAENRPLARV